MGSRCDVFAHRRRAGAGGQVMSKELLKQKILGLVREYHGVAHQRPEFEPGKSKVTYSGRVYDEKELVNLVDSALDFWLTAGPYAERFEARMRSFLGSPEFILVNSGSSANLVMVSALCSPGLKEQAPPGTPEPLKQGDEIITPAVTFPTTLTPIVQNGLVPVFVDCEIGTYNINPGLLEGAVGPRTRAILVPHTLGIPCDMEVVIDVAQRHNLWVLEDACDALGATFNDRLVGTFGAMASLSFFPAHQMTMGEGGGVVINHPWLKATAVSIRDWGRHCWCEPGKNNTCGRRFGWQLGQLPHGYDHKYVYSNLGYNLKVTDMQAAIGLAQMDKLESFVAARRRNFQRLHEELRSLEGKLVLPRIDKRANPSPFGFPITVQNGNDRQRLISHLEAANIETRLVFGGSILRQPGFMHIEHRVHGSLEQSDAIMERTLFVGIYPGLTDEMVDYIARTVRGFFDVRP
jgi:CDP-6-deoxy-D-xylo-4-hexulose-3-dehydrase